MAGTADSAPIPIKQCVLKKLPDAIEDSLYQDEKFPLLIDPSEQALRFLKYQLLYPMLTMLQ